MTASARRFGPRKSLGQHFLHDTRVVQRIIDAADLSPEDTVVEIGPGRGVLTRRLVQQAGRVIAVELDSQLCEELPPPTGISGESPVRAGRRPGGRSVRTGIRRGGSKSGGIQSRRQPAVLRCQSHHPPYAGVGGASHSGPVHGAEGSG
ncbi:Ribosomal RNA small subunit methyltransferase A [Geodia barretti]|uniref:rRNA adenine N(6)-methyltransferase n=1 Tax=Geodia barretti TaxID=519541 RepID=A0AA35TSH5_GEOBA|nr:Ribosomal RNA small subunit methyltransferase A [Geodia barretti]